MTSDFTAADLEQLAARGSQVEEVRRQLQAFRDGFPATVLVYLFPPSLHLFPSLSILL
jgi:hypothetical protein